MRRLNLATLDWQLTGWRPYEWEQAVADLGVNPAPDVGPIPTRVPGSVHAALTAAGLLPDWSRGVQTRACEWVEHRHWLLETDVPHEWLAGDAHVVLRCAGLDYAGFVLVDRRPVASFADSFVPHEFVLTDSLQPGAGRIGLAFIEHPPFLGQVYFTSRVTAHKPRFSYGWDWTPRLVQTGVTDRLELVETTEHRLVDVHCTSSYQAADETGGIQISGRAAACAQNSLVLTIGRGNDQVLRQSWPATSTFELTAGVADVQGWWPNGMGDQPLYDVRLDLIGSDETVLDSWTCRTGFRSITWRDCLEAPADALPWICVVNGAPIFLQGFNWVPVRALSADVTDDDYRNRLTTYRDLGTNVLRAWGGAGPERDSFYELCDELGILVWQDFPLSSSGLDNSPPSDQQSIDGFVRVAASYIRRRQHHPSLLLWCGGNELTTDPPEARPLDLQHPLLAALADTVAELDPQRRYIPTSPTGPRFAAAEDEFGHGLHHEVHGPWWAPADPDQWANYWANDDALFRSELGVPGSASSDLIRTYGQDAAWPGSDHNPYWVHTCPWWQSLEWPIWCEHVARTGIEGTQDEFVAWSQRRQSDALATAVAACKSRFPRCGGVIIWMGHDCHPCPLNTSVIDFEGRPKPAALALAALFGESPQRH